jgi:hypothetical protein
MLTAFSLHPMTSVLLLMRWDTYRAATHQNKIFFLDYCPWLCYPIYLQKREWCQPVK